MKETIIKVKMKPNWRKKGDERAREEALEGIRRELIEAMYGHANDDATFEIILSVERPIFTKAKS